MNHTPGFFKEMSHYTLYKDLSWIFGMTTVEAELMVLTFL